jgi:2'-5' RNA ligase
MAFAVTLLFDAATAAAIAARWELLAAAGVSRSMLDLGYSPHVTLVVHDGAIDAGAADALDRVFAQVDRMAVTLSGVTTFGAGSGVCYAAMAPSPDMMRLHARTVNAMDDACRPHYQTGRWTPHCTLATDMSDLDMGRANALLDPDWRPLEGFFERAELVEFVPVVGIKSWTLSTPRSTRTP